MSSYGLMSQEVVVYTQSGILCSSKKRQNYAVCHNMNGTKEYHAEYGVRKGQMQKDFSYICNLTAKQQGSNKESKAAKWEG